MKTKIFYASVNVSRYDGCIDFDSMSYDEAKAFFENDKVKCATCEEITVDGTKANQLMFSNEGYDGDTMFVWVKTC